MNFTISSSDFLISLNGFAMQFHIRSQSLKKLYFLLDISVGFMLLKTDRTDASPSELIKSLIKNIPPKESTLLMTNFSFNSTVFFGISQRTEEYFLISMSLF